MRPHFHYVPVGKWDETLVKSKPNHYWCQTEMKYYRRRMNNQTWQYFMMGGFLIKNFETGKRQGRLNSFRQGSAHPSPSPSLPRSRSPEKFPTKAVNSMPSNGQTVMCSLRFQNTLVSQNTWWFVRCSLQNQRHNVVIKSYWRRVNWIFVICKRSDHNIKPMN